MSHIEVTIPQLQKIFRMNLRRSGGWQPIVLLSAPGIGKTDIGTVDLRCQYAEFLGIEPEQVGLVVEKIAERDAAELAGVALPHKGKDGAFETRFSKSPLIRRVEDEIEAGREYGILVLDEIAAARDPEQKAVSGALDRSRMIGSTKIPDGWIVIGTGNRAADKAGASRLLSHLTNRIKVFHVKFSMPAWTKWARSRGVNEIGVECAEAQGDDWFVQAVPVEDKAYCTPRSYVEALDDLDAYIAEPDFAGVVDSVMEKMLAANIGMDRASTLCQWIAQRDHVPTAEQIMTNPQCAKVPDQTGFQMIAAHVAMGAVKDADTATRAFHYIERLRTDLHVSLCVKLLNISTEHGWVITDPAASAFIARYHELLPLT